MNERLKKCIEYLISQNRLHNASDLAKAIGKQRSYVSEVLSGKREVSEQFVRALTNKFPEISEDWLLNGVGEMQNFTKIYDRINYVLSQEGITKREFEKGTNTGNFLFPGIYHRAEHNPGDIGVVTGWIDCLLNLYPKYSREWLLHGTGDILTPSQEYKNVSGVIITGSGNANNASIDNRQYYSDSPDVLRNTINGLEEEITLLQRQIDTLKMFLQEKESRISEKDAQIKEKDAQIKEKDAQIKQLLDILQKK